MRPRNVGEFGILFSQQVADALRMQPWGINHGNDMWNSWNSRVTHVLEMNGYRFSVTRVIDPRDWADEDSEHDWSELPCYWLALDGDLHDVGLSSMGTCFTVAQLIEFLVATSPLTSMSAEAGYANQVIPMGLPTVL